MSSSDNDASVNVNVEDVTVDKDVPVASADGGQVGMFEDASEGHDIPPERQLHVKAKEKAQQTKRPKQKSVEVQVVERDSVATQTDAREEVHSVKVVADHTEKLFHFLTTIEPQMMHQLERNLSSTAFDGYDLDSSDNKDSVSLQTSLGHKEFISAKLAVTDVSWNCTGGTVAAAYGRYDHGDWCNHQAGACLWNVNRRTMNREVADVVLETSSCLMCIAYHPKDPAVLIGGTFNGDVMMWDLSGEAPVSTCTVLGPLTHGEPLSTVEWIWDIAMAKFEICSVGSDGKILVWDPHHLQQPTAGLLLFTRGDKKKTTGGTAASFSAEDKNIFVVGTEAGAVYKASLARDPNRLLGGRAEEFTFPSPITFTYDKHAGPVHAAACSPFHRNVFATCGTDCVRVYDALGKQPALSFEPSTGYLFDVAWGTVRPMLLMVAAADGFLYIYDLQQNKTSPVVQLQVAEDAALHCIATNPRTPSLLATGDALGIISVCSLSMHLASEQTGELEALEALTSRDVDNDGIPDAVDPEIK